MIHARLVILLADASQFLSLGRKFRRSNAAWSLTDVLIGMVVVALIGGAVWLLVRWGKAQQQRIANSPGSLFRELCKAHKLDWSSRRLLSQLASWRGIDHPARLFLEPEWFESVTLSPALSPEGQRVEQLRDQIFGRRLEPAEKS